MPQDPHHISPTAHYTAYVWVHHGLSEPALATRTGAVMYRALRSMHRLSADVIGGNTLEEGLLQRHLLIDHHLAAAVEAGSIGQVVEVACGLSGRGVRFKRRFPSLTWVEADLAPMADHKRRLLDTAHLRAPGHHVVATNALHDDGPESLWAATAGLLDPTRPTALITEGLLPYYPREEIVRMWARFARFLGGFPAGLYLSDIRLRDETANTTVVRGFRAGLRLFARAPADLEMDSVTDATTQLLGAGFDRATLHHPRDHADVPGLPPARGATSPRVVEAWTGAPG